MKNLNFLSKSSSRDCGHSSVTLALTVGSPSVHRRSTMLRLLSVLVLVLTLGVGQIWGDTYTLGWGDASGAQGTYTNFNSTSGSVTNLVSFSTAKNSAQNAPATGSDPNTLRLYYASNGSGGSVTLTPAEGVTITGFSINTTTNPTTKYQVGSSSLTAISLSGSSSNYSGSITNLSVSSSSSITIKNCNTSNTQLRIKTIAITYTVASSKQDLTLGLSYSPNPIILGENASSTPTLTGNSGSGTVTYTLEDVSPSGCVTINASTGVLTPAKVGTATVRASVAETSSYNAGSKTCAVSVVKKYTVTLKDDDSALSQTTVGGSVTLPSRAGCTGYTFAGWSTTNNATWTTTAPTIINAGNYTPTSDINLYPVYTKTETGGTTDKTKTETFENQAAEQVYNSTKTYNAANSNAGLAWSMYYGCVSTTNYLTTSKSAHMRWYSSATSNYPYIKTTTAVSGLQTITFNAAVQNTNIKMKVEKSTNGSTWTAVASNIAMSTSKDEYSYDIDGTIGTGYYIRIGVDGANSTAPSSGNWTFRVDDVKFDYTETGGSTTSYISVPNCCTSLGSINGSVSLTQLTSGDDKGKLKATWDEQDDTDGWATNGIKIKFYKVGTSNDTTCVHTSDALANSTTAYTWSGTPDKCATYFARLVAVHGSDDSYCAGDVEGGESDDVITAGYSVDVTGVTNVTPATEFPATTCASGFSIASMTPGDQYELPTSITVTGASHTWNSTTGALTISNVTGDVTITITGSKKACTPMEKVTVTPAVTYNGATLSWSAVDHVSKYKVYIKTSADVEVEKDEDIASSTTSYTVSEELEHLTTYKYSVVAVSEDEDTYCSSTQDGTFTTVDYPAATLTLSEVGGDDYAIDNISHKLFDVVKLPSTLTYAGCTGKVLVGWSSVAIETPGSKPASNYWDKGADYTLSSTSGKLYAVYATKQGGKSEEEYTFSSFTAAADVTINTPTNFNIELHKNSASTNPTWNGNSEEARIYAKGSLKITSSEPITKVVFVYNANSGNSGAPTISGVTGKTNAGTWNANTKTWTGSDSEITFSTSGSSGNIGFKKVTVTTGSDPTYSAYTTVCAAALANPTFDPAEDAEEEYLAAQDLTISGPTGATIYYTMTTDGTEPDDPTDESDEYTSTISMNSRATYWIKAFAKKGTSESEIVEAKYNINLPFTVAEAISIIPNNNDERAKTYIDGIVCTAATSLSSGAMTYYISDDGSETSRIRIYSGKGLNDANFSATTDLKVGDKVRVYGKLNNYSGSYDVDNSYLTSLVTATVNSIEIGGTATKTAYTAGDNTFSYAGLTATATYNTGYVKDVTSEATWKANGVTSYTVTETENVSVTATYGGKTSDATVVGVTYTTKTVKSIYLEYESTYTYKGMALPKPKVYVKYVEEIADEEVTSLVEAANGYDTESAYNKDVVDTYTIKVAYQSKEATYTVEVRAIFNDIDHPYTPSEATTIIVEAIGQVQSTDYIYVAGKVSAIDGSIDNNTLKYYISYDGTTTGQLYVYKGKYINNANFTNNNILVVGDEVVVKALAQNYEGNLPELKSSQVMKHYRAPQFTFADIVAGDEFEYDYSPDLAVTPTQNSGDAAFTLESDDESIVTIVDGKLHAAGVGTTKITASREATNLANQMNYSAKTAEFNVTVIAKRTRYAITMDADGGTGTDPVYENQLEGATVNLPATCPYSKANHAFAAWEVNETVSGDEVTITDGHFTMPAAAVTIKATWNEVATCHISFQVNGAEVATADAPETEAYSLAGISHPNVDGFTWVGWSTTKYDNETTTLPSTITSYTPAASEATKTLYGIYSRVDINGENYGKYVKVTSAPTDWSGQYLIVYEAGNKAMDGSLSSMSSSGNGIIVTIADGIVTATTTENKTLDGSSFTIAKAETNYSIRSASGKYIGCTGSSNGFNENATTVYTNAISLENNVLSITSSGGPKLQCWVQNTSYQFRYYASSQNALALYKKDNGTTYYTSSPVEKVTITFNAKGGNGGCSTTTINKGSQLTICADVPTKSHSEFAGWNSDEEGNGDAYVAGTAYTFNASTTIYAQWTDATPHAVTYVANGATGSVPTIEDQYAGDQFNIAAKGALEKDGFDFVGWTYNGILYKAGVSFTMQEEAVEFVAQWKKQNVVKMSLITSIDQLVSGTTIVLASKDPVQNDVVKPSALAGDLGSNKFLASVTTDITFSGNEVSYTNEDVLELVVEQVDGGWKLRKDGTNYLKETSVKNLTWDVASEATIWTITFNNGNVNIASDLGSIKYNAQDPRFTTYASGQKDIQLYGKATVVSGEVNISNYGYVDGDVIVLNNNATLTVDANIAPSTVIVPNGSTVTVNDNKTVNANTVIVENGGTLNIADEGTVNTAETLIIHSTLGKGTGTSTSGNAPGNCGQITNGDNNNITVNGDVYLELELTQDNAASEGWYAFSVPFPVDALNGVYYGDTKLQNEVGYAIMSHYGDLRAQNEYAWKKFRGIMQPGVFYVITVGDTDYKTLRFKKVAGEALVASTSVAVSPFPTQTSNNADGAWNGIGNPNLQISNLSTPVTAMQFYDHKSNSFIGRDHSVNLVVGSAFFIQYNATSSVSIPTTIKDGHGYLAPQRERNAVEETIYKVELTNMTTSELEDNVFLTAREDATNEYVIGRDVAKMSMGTAKCAQMWVPAYGTQLCAADFQLVNDKAEYPLTITAPQAGTYSISTVANENADLYLTYEGAIIWNLSMGAYEIELTKGTTNGYGIVLQAKAPNAATGVDEINAEAGAQKVIIDEHVYILRGGQMYDVNGKMVK